jgi:glycosyltransferase involved in cell wall biosynthesis
MVYLSLLKVVYLTQVFELEDDFGSDRHSYFCRKLVEAGHEVVAITSNVNYKTSQLKHKQRGFRPIRIRHKGMDIYYVFSTPRFQRNFPKRILYFLTFFVSAFGLRKKIKGAGVIYAVSTPLTVGFLGYLLSLLSGSRFILEVTDVWPDVHIAMGFLRNKALIRILRRLELFCYAKADSIVALTRGIQRNIQSKTRPKEKVILITNGVDQTLFNPNPGWEAEIHDLKNRWNPKGKFVALYLGAHGLYNSLQDIVEAAPFLREDPEIQLVLIGDGDEKVRLLARAEALGLDNISFIPPIPRRQAPLYLRLADVFLLTNLKGEFFDLNLPNKLFDYLASARPVILAGAGESADLIRESHSGKIIEPQNPSALASAIREVKAMPAKTRETMGKDGRTYVLAHYERDALSRTFLALIEEAPPGKGGS